MNTKRKFRSHKRRSALHQLRGVVGPGATQKRPPKVVLTSYTLLYNLIYSLGRWFTAFNRGEGTYLKLSGVSMIYARRDESGDSGDKKFRYLHTWIKRIRFVNCLVKILVFDVWFVVTVGLAWSVNVGRVLNPMTYRVVIYCGWSVI